MTFNDQTQGELKKKIQKIKIILPLLFQTYFMISYEWGHCKKKEIKSKQFIKITYNMHYEKMPFNRSK